ncbi:tyrosine-type recombinase/integrase [Ruminococcaceae bacterium OttesenSCG-928-D13]|nr:tyrosine-type recombinase/integrase [Ruminococcaceae bacterium OttesenSCG-928-D13]
MASVERFEGKNGPYFKVTASDGFREDGRPYKVKRSFHPEPGLSQREINRALDQFTKELELEVRKKHAEENIKGASHNASRQSFRDHAKAFLALCEGRKNVKLGTIDNYRSYITGHMDDFFGDRPIGNISTKDIDQFLAFLASEGARKNSGYAVVKTPLYPLLQTRGLSQKAFAEKCGLSECTISGVAGRDAEKPIEELRVSIPTAKKIAEGLDEPLAKLFELHPDNRPLSDKTILENYKVLVAVFRHAEKRGYIQANPMSAVMRPPYRRKKVEAWTPEQVRVLLKALEALPESEFRWRMYVTLLIATAGRREDVSGLQWKHIYFDVGEDQSGQKDGSGLVYIEQGLVYSKEYGFYLDSTKGNDFRPLKLAASVMDLLREYREWYRELRESYIDEDGTDLWRVPTSERMEKLAKAFPQIKRSEGDADIISPEDFLFVQAGGFPGYPGSVAGWLNKFTKENGLPHLNPHLIRHTMASAMFGDPDFDIKTISARLGHASTAVTEAVYIDRLKATNAVRSKPIFDLLNP